MHRLSDIVSSFFRVAAAVCRRSAAYRGVSRRIAAYCVIRISFASSSELVACPTEGLRAAIMTSVRIIVAKTHHHFHDLLDTRNTISMIFLLRGTYAFRVWPRSPVASTDPGPRRPSRLCFGPPESGLGSLQLATPLYVRRGERHSVAPLCIEGDVTQLAESGSSSSKIPCMLAWRVPTASLPVRAPWAASWLRHQVGARGRRPDYVM